jgi:hypothetical protein
LTQAKVILELETRGQEHIADIQQTLVAAGFVLELNGP